MLIKSLNNEIEGSARTIAVTPMNLIRLFLLFHSKKPASPIRRIQLLPRFRHESECNLAYFVQFTIAIQAQPSPSLTITIIGSKL